ncbi:outer membrane lipoprotein-sorting protein [Marinilongibacter aquaticus]|uniref:outer membrane lipoprotein-sorting protein n=1 Tax=Marinilongibacter aquaticus TaxID=2975157 RepID=UPI0021BD1339|nr:outer membrane lipoprotein-sorting protein [Marinilongibacter aquaticus]UBM60356.1 outer membrane lipoprotein-sorting protein [Marinilongibacter aquaticus]
MKTKILLGLILLLSTQMWAQDANAIVAKADDKMRGNKNYSEITVQIIRPTWKRELKMKSWSLGTEFSLSYLLSPAKDKGTVFLKRNRELWNWLPAIERTIKMPPSMLSQSWMGSDLTNDDMVKETSNKDDFSSKIIGEETVGGRKCWKIDMSPKPNAAVVWGKVVTWVDQKDYIYMKTEYYDEDEYLVHTMQATDIKTLGGRLLASRIEVIPADEKGNKTVMILNKVDFNANVGPSFFTVQNMKRVK